MTVLSPVLGLHCPCHQQSPKSSPKCLTVQGGVLIADRMPLHWGYSTASIQSLLSSDVPADLWAAFLCPFMPFLHPYPHCLRKRMPTFGRVLCYFIVSGNPLGVLYAVPGILLRNFNYMRMGRTVPSDNWLQVNCGQRAKHSFPVPLTMRCVIKREIYTASVNSDCDFYSYSFTA